MCFKISLKVGKKWELIVEMSTYILFYIYIVKTEIGINSQKLIRLSFFLYIFNLLLVLHYIF